MRITSWWRWNARRIIILFALALGALLVALIAATRGAVHIPLGAIFEIILRPVGFFSSGYLDAQQSAVFWNIRLPRVIMGLLVGGVLAVSGACLQGLFRNPLADPGLIGISSGAALSVASAIVLVGGWLGSSFWQEWGFLILPLMAFAGGLLATFVICGMATIGRQVRIAILLLAGIAINALCGAGIGWMTYLATDDQLRMITFWGLGSLGGSSWSQLKFAGPIMMVVLLFSPCLSRGLNALAMGEAEAGHMGFSVRRLKRHAVLLSALGVGAAVSVSGIIGFVGLVVPHLLRLAVGADNRWVIPGSALAGSMMLLLSDLVARTAVAPAEIPIGVVVSTIGAPFFIYLIMREKSRLLS